MSWAASLQLHAFRSFPDVEPGDDLVAHLVGCIRADQIEIRPDDIFVLAQKIVSKAEGRYVNIADVVASDRAVEIARLRHLKPDAAKGIGELDEPGRLLRLPIHQRQRDERD